ncbi:N-acetylmuramoyl-L-alanine amidase [Candidatus Riflebacteria bacterium]
MGFKKYFLILCIILWPSTVFSYNSRITDVRYWLSQQFGELVIDIKGRFKQTPIKKLPDGTRYFDLMEVFFRPRKKTFLLEDEYFKGIKLSQRKAGVRVFFEITDERSEVSVFEQLKTSRTPQRVIIKVKSGRLKTRRWINNLKNRGKWIKKNRGYLIAIDPGHGGEDPGCSKKGLVEKDLNLVMANEIQKLARNLKNVTVVSTRNQDKLIPLKERYEIAEYYGAHLFISIHFNSNKDKNVHGSEIYYLSNKGAWSTAVDKAIAEQASASKDRRSPPEFNKVFNKIIKLQATQKFYSQKLALHISKQFDRLGFVRNRGVKKAGYAVLQSNTIPSVLVENLYLTSPKDRALARQKSKIKRLAAAILLGGIKFLNTEKSVRGVDLEYLKYCHRRARTGGKVKFYRIKRGDTIEKISRMYGIKPGTLLAYNYLTKNHFLNIGAILKIPGKREIRRFMEINGDEKHSYFDYRIRRGDSLSLIARKFGIKSSKIQSINRRIKNWDKIHPGQKIYIPHKRGLKKKKYRASRKQLQMPRKWKAYIVKKGDTLSGIAIKSRTAMKILEKKNGLRNKHSIWAGMKLWIPIN